MYFTYHSESLCPDDGPETQYGGQDTGDDNYGIKQGQGYGL